MSATDDKSTYLKIDEAARLLRVSPRTIYRRIWNGDLPASKVGGLYLINREDLEAILAESRVTPSRELSSGEVETQPLKCGSCFRLLTSDSQIGEICQADRCDKIICMQCVSEGIQYCVQHSPTREEQLQRAKERHQRGEIPTLVKGSTARLRELNFLNRIQSRISSIPTLVHPLSGEILTIQNWEIYLERGDQRAEVMQLLGKVLLDTNTLARFPFNAWISYQVPPQKKRGDFPLEIYVQVISRLPAMLREGFDTQPLQADELTPWLVRMSEEAQRQQTFKIILLSSTTGWDSSARQVIQGQSLSPTSKSQPAFAHRQILFYLFDLETGQLLYNLRDDRARRYAELFAPLLPSEEIEEAAEAIEKELMLYESLTLQYATEILSYPKDVIRQAFARLAATGRYALTEVPELGTTLVRH